MIPVSLSGSARRHRTSALCSLASRPRPTASTTPATSTTPAASRWSRAWTTSPRHEVVERRCEALDNLEHRGADGRRRRAPATAPASSCRCRTRSSARSSTSSCPSPAATASAICFLPQRPGRRAQARGAARAQRRASRASVVLGWRDVPVDDDHVGDTANAHAARTCASSSSGPARASRHDQDAFERKLYVIRRIGELAAGPDFYVAELLLADDRLQGHADPRPGPRLLPRPAATSASPSALALVHSRFSTNTFPSWELAHPYRVIAHNGEINTLHGQRQLDARARVAAGVASSSATTSQKVMPIVRPGGSDSATFDNVLELLMLAGRSLPHAVMMMIPEAYAGPRRPPRRTSRASTPSTPA